jgi:hypothetical protein
MNHFAPFHNFCNVSEHFIYSLSSRQLTQSEARIVAHYCNVLLAVVQPSLAMNSPVKNNGHESAFVPEMQ